MDRLAESLETTRPTGNSRGSSQRGFTPGFKCGFTRGFTIIELMILLCVASILSLIAVPAMRGFLVRTHLSTTATSLHGGLLYSRSEALARGKRIILCPREAAWPASCAQGMAANWNAGWLVFEEGVLARGDGSEVLRSFDGLAESVTIEAVRYGVSFAADGILLPRGPATLERDFRIAVGQQDRVRKRHVRVARIVPPRIQDGACSADT